MEVVSSVSLLYAPALFSAGIRVFITLPVPVPVPSVVNCPTVIGFPRGSVPAAVAGSPFAYAIVKGVVGSRLYIV